MSPVSIGVGKRNCPHIDYDDYFDKCNDCGYEGRSCSVCGTGMSQGYYCCDEYYCSDECLHTIMSAKEWEEHYTDDGDCHWTKWEE